VGRGERQATRLKSLRDKRLRGLRLADGTGRKGYKDCVPVAGRAYPGSLSVRVCPYQNPGHAAYSMTMPRIS
jgi:hypothetical protein